MLNIEKTQSANSVYVSGILNELDIVTGTTTDGREWIRGSASIKCDQDINGKNTECIVPIKMFSMRLKKDGEPNKIYDRILGYKDKLVSAAAADDINSASKITVTNGQLEENIWIDKSTNKPRSSFQIVSNFLNDKKDADKEGAIFKLSGVVLNDPMEAEEHDRNGDPTGRLVIKFGVIGYAGKIHVLDLIADGSAKAHVEQNWSKGDTVKATGKVNITHKVVTIEEKQGFGESIETNRTISNRELIITGGSASGLEEDLSYDADSIKKALDIRKAEQDKLAENNTTAKASPKSKSVDLGF